MTDTKTETTAKFVLRGSYVNAFGVVQYRCKVINATSTQHAIEEFERKYPDTIKGSVKARWM